MRRPTTAVMRPPVRKLMRRGERLEKSLAGETTLAATLTVRVAMSKAIIAKTTAKGLPRRARTATGFQSASPKMIRVAEVTAMSMNEYKVIESGKRQRGWGEEFAAGGVGAAGHDLDA